MLSFAFKMGKICRQTRNDANHRPHVGAMMQTGNLIRSRIKSRKIKEIRFIRKWKTIG